MAKFSDEKTDQLLRESHAEEAEDVARILSSRYGMEYADLSILPIDPEALRLIPQEEAAAAQVIPFAKENKIVRIGIRKPHSPAVDQIVHELKENGYDPIPYLVTAQSVEKGLARYKDLSLSSKSTAGSFDISPQRLQNELADIMSLEVLIEKVEALTALDKARRATRLLELLFAGGVALHASDIHLEPGEDAARLRLRLNGVLTDVSQVDLSTYTLLVSRIKLLSGMKLNVHTSSQDGRFSISIGERDIEVRSSSIPDAHGESIVLRLLDPKQGDISLQEIGMHPLLLKKIEAELRKPHGMVLTTGPTGSGKTTTLYAFLKKIYTPDIKIITIEDPVEYKISGIVQTQVEKGKYTFEGGLRSALRQDPDVIMVGEIRDREVAETALQAALTGHIVFSTLHTNSAAGTFPRLSDLGLDPKSFGSGITVSLAQRLVRTLDPKTRIKKPLIEEDRAFIERIVKTMPEEYRPETLPEFIYEPDTSTPNEGYSGRTAVFEAIFMTDDISTFLREYPSERDIQEKAVAQGNLTLIQDAILKVLAGTTSLKEVRRVIGG